MTTKSVVDKGYLVRFVMQIQFLSGGKNHSPLTGMGVGKFMSSLQMGLYVIFTKGNLFLNSLQLKIINMPSGIFGVACPDPLYYISLRQIPLTPNPYTYL